MKKHPIIFSSEMVQAILDGRKTQTRRVIKPQPKDDIEKHFTGHWISGLVDDSYERVHICSYGQVGDRLWVRESWATEKIFDSMSAKQIEDTGVGTIPFWYKVNDWQIDRDGQIRGRWRTGRFCPHWASRITLEITEIRVQRLQEITEGDAMSEGVNSHLELNKDGWRTAIDDFKDLWDSINIKRGYGWGINPWVWVISFKRLDNVEP